MSRRPFQTRPPTMASSTASVATMSFQRIEPAKGLVMGRVAAGFRPGRVGLAHEGLVGREHALVAALARNSAPAAYFPKCSRACRMASRSLAGRPGRASRVTQAAPER